MKMNQQQLDKAIALIETYKKHLPNKAKAKLAYVEMFEKECPELHGFIGMRLVDDPLTILSRKNLDGLNLAGRTFEKIDFSRSSMRYVDLTDCSLSLCNITSTDFEGADISHSELLSCTIRGTSFRRASLCESIISCDFDLFDAVVEYSSVDFSHADLDSAKLENLSLDACNFSFANANCTDFVDSYLNGCDMRTAFVMGATWKDCYVSKSLWREGTEPTEKQGAVDYWER